jgi:hypothetical protein
MTKKNMSARPKKYESKLALENNVEFNDLFKVAIENEQPKKKAAPKKKK